MVSKYLFVKLENFDYILFDFLGRTDVVHDTGIDKDRRFSKVELSSIKCGMSMKKLFIHVIFVLRTPSTVSTEPYSICIENRSTADACSGDTGQTERFYKLFCSHHY